MQREDGRERASSEGAAEGLYTFRKAAGRGAHDAWPEGVAPNPFRARLAPKPETGALSPSARL